KAKTPTPVSSAPYLILRPPVGRMTIADAATQAAAPHYLCQSPAARSPALIQVKSLGRGLDHCAAGSPTSGGSGGGSGVSFRMGCRMPAGRLSDPAGLR